MGPNPAQRDPVRVMDARQVAIRAWLVGPLGWLEVERFV